ncbi:thiamine/thiamine pyrophosphate ABC transporter permease ThiP [Agrobacterium fabrum]|jgi:thiamine transport system permease protein|uniref:Thiamine transport system permease protein n=1 Tax=Agrobacterium fabrum TaxID=1176649 RepID=A0A7Z7BQE3_9HYPH|nr:thiamine/thiamine pyrophosphate ABC transporter permease ThiP [Agrobacterium fabrum]MCR6723877.1 thiamine/thiamine pyrophosphate ABC transporter permease ThiP [Agrobacterium fabrum]WCK75982.1 thiamine/thiamine pyrophosphate ABC transporter permease ThiP [Agrobacterium fabrum]WIE27078.1 thiamine/thiamine pyrophosphate ABC transporter permease ThiP [Agrobacterium fabrum]WIE43035.1 thiamine/thiamine pyrophosphate ABC transporter permease ThiP [Agrobacterium fabrum]CUX32244.1 Thiamine transport
MMLRRDYRRSIIFGTAAFAAVFLFMALAVFALLSFDVGASAAGVMDAYTLRILRFTLYQATLSTLLSIALGLPVALALARRKEFPGRIWIIRLMAVPMGLPVIVGAFGIITIWGRQGVLNSALVFAGADEPFSIYGLSGILIAHVFFNLPLSVRLMLAGLERIPGEYWRMAASLGMGPVSVFRFIEWPAVSRLIPGIAGLVFMLCATSFTLVLLLGGGPAATTLEVAIYHALRFDFDPQRAIALSVLQIVLTAVLLGLLAFLPSPEAEISSLGRNIRRFDGRTTGARLWDGAAIVFAVFLVGLPLVAIAVSGLQADLSRLLIAPIFLRAAATSVLIAMLSAILVVLCCMGIIGARQAIGSRRQVAWPFGLLSALLGAGSSLVLLVPPVVLGSGWFLLLRVFGDASFYAPVLVALINMLMALPLAMRVMEPAFTSHFLRTGRLSASLGLQGYSRLRFADLPVLWRPMLMALSFAMALSLGDLGAVALFGSENFVTLPWLVYSNMGSYRTNDAAGYAFLLGVVCLLLAAGGTSRQSPSARAGI